jgi:hypothetical protein
LELHKSLSHFEKKKPKGRGISSVPSFEKHTLDFRSQTSNFQSFEKKEGVDFIIIIIII